ncbi:hypothetical protein Ndes2526B_g08144 [Nannochloris sp. 'desiccata']|nr:hypothetical protein KSW81_002777 [Chlorella desiccata (nom. nud.)]
MDGHTAEQVLLRLQDELKSLHTQPGLGGDACDFRAPPPSKGSGPRLFCGHVPKEATEDLVKAHFSRWGVVTDVYFPRHKKTLKRRPFCFVTFAVKDSAERALAESPLSICGIPIKNLTMVEDRDTYYKEKHAVAHQALLIALNSMGATGALAPEQINNIAALLAMEGVSSDAVLSMLLNPSQHNLIAQQQAAPLSQGIQNFGAAASGGGGYLSRTSFSSPPHQQQQQYQGQVNRFSAPQSGQFGPSLSDYFLYQGHQPNIHNHNQYNQQQQQQHPPTSGGSGSSNSMRSASGPLPNSIGPFGSMMSREDSFSSLSTISDWYSTTSSNRTSLDLGNSGFWGPGAGQPPARLSMDAALQLRQQLMAVAAATQQGGGGGSQQLGGGDGGGDGSFNQAQLLVAQNLALQRLQQQHSPTPPPPPAAVMQSAFYQSAAPVPINHHSSSSSPNGGMHSVSSPLQGASSLPLPPIREGHPGPLDPGTCAVWASAQFGGSLLGGNGVEGSHVNNADGVGAQFLGGSPVLRPPGSTISPTSSGPVSPVRPSPNNNNSNDNLTIQLRELSLSNYSLRGSPATSGLPLGINPDSFRSDVDSFSLSTRNASGGNGLVDGGAAPWAAPLENPSQRPSA